MGAFICIPAISGHAYHPFTISSSPIQSATNGLSFHIKAMGQGSFTRKLFSLAAANGGETLRHVIFDGPYGAPFVCKEGTQNVLLLCGGIGATPCIAILRDLYERVSAGDPMVGCLCRVRLVWAARSAELFSAFKEPLAM